MFVYEFANSILALFAFVFCLFVYLFIPTLSLWLFCHLRVCIYLSIFRFPFHLSIVFLFSGSIANATLSNLQFVGFVCVAKHQSKKVPKHWMEPIGGCDCFLSFSPLFSLFSLSFSHSTPA